MKKNNGISRLMGAGLMAGALALTTLAVPALAQEDQMTAIATPAQPNAIPLNTGPLPGATVSESWHSQYGSIFARNVTEATLTPFLPDPAKATGAAVIIAPGGAFMTLSMENEGWDVARALADRGVAAFVLKYRTNQTPADLGEFGQAMNRVFERVGAAPAPSATPPASAPPAGGLPRLQPQVADANAAFALVRANASKWGVDPDRIGMIGFSAGAMLSMVTTLTSEEAKPAFVGNIYCSLAAVDVPADAPPLFMAIAADDGLFAKRGFGLIESWEKAGRPVEFHYYERGGHGFGMYQKATTSTQWFHNFVKWIEMHGFLKAKS